LTAKAGKTRQWTDLLGRDFGSLRTKDFLRHLGRDDARPTSFLAKLPTTEHKGGFEKIQPQMDADERRFRNIDRKSLAATATRS